MAEFFHVYVPGALVAPPPEAQPAVLPDGYVLELTQRYPAALPSALGLVGDWFPDGLTQHGIRYLLAANPELERDRATELLWEAVRRAGYNDRPSRFNSIFACETLEDARAFQVQHRWARPSPIHRVDGQSRLKANMALLGGSAGAGAQVLTQACSYWSGERGTASESWEHLLEPPVTVLGTAL